MFKAWIRSLATLVLLGSTATGAVAQGPASVGADLAYLNRLSFGANPASWAELQALGRKEWLSRQLRPGLVVLPEAVQIELNSFAIGKQPIQDIVFGLEDLKNRPEATDENSAKRSVRIPEIRQQLREMQKEASQRSLLMAVHSPRQVHEQLTWFWFNHFNVHRNSQNLPALVGDYEDRAIRAHALGKFKDLLLAVATHPAMLRYLNNERNRAGKINENYARELMELHTLGVDGGYSQTDVQSLARILTGLTTRFTRPPAIFRPGHVLFSNGLAEFDPRRHDRGSKVWLGQTISGGGWEEIEAALNTLARHPSTARFISFKLARHFVADQPPQALVDRMAQCFLRTDGDLVAVFQLMVESAEFEASLGQKFKDPFHYLVSAYRLVPPERPVPPDSRAGLHWLDQLGQVPMGRPTPDGYPLEATAWNASGQMTLRFEFAQALAAGQRGLGPAGAGQRPAGVQAIEIDWLKKLWLPVLTERTGSVLAGAKSAGQWSALFLSSPEFMFR